MFGVGGSAKTKKMADANPAISATFIGISVGIRDLLLPTRTLVPWQETYGDGGHTSVAGESLRPARAVDSYYLFDS
jgi:hypothetical protein